MTNEPIVVKRTFNAPVEQVWLALTSTEQMKQWYFDIAAFTPEAGFQFSFEGGDENQKYLHLCTIKEVVPFKKLSHTWRYEGQDAETLVTWELTDNGDTTQVTLTHSGIENIEPNGPAFARQNFADGWNHIVGVSLKDHLEKKQEE